MQTVATEGLTVQNATRDAALQTQLLDRRERLKSAASDRQNTDQIVLLLDEIDAALERMDKGTFGVCETCHDTIENERLLVDPLCRNCLDHLSPKELKAFERDLDLAYQVQRGLLPKPDLTIDGWQVSYHYDPAGSVSGDYCDIIASESEPGTFYFLVGDVTGKGVAASLLMAHLHAIFRSLITSNLPTHELVQRANRIFTEGTIKTHFATLVCGRASKNGDVEICNAGHCLPLHVGRDVVRALPSTGLPLGLLCDGTYNSVKLNLAPSESLVLYTDGLSESTSAGGVMYGDERLNSVAAQNGHLSPGNLIAAYLEDLRGFQTGKQRSDDLTLMVVRRG